MVAQVAANRIQAALREVGSLRHAAGTPALAANEAKHTTAATVVVLSPAPPSTIPQIDSDELQAAVKNIAQNIRIVQRSLQFSVDEISGRTVITVVDKETNEVIRQIPPKEALALAQRLEDVAGLFVVETA
ncbi:MAG: flagellar protein FlaG [Gammaproteobacteria bacterium]|nr:flagellar protein FlaG [Gammaproteobacteria bacterium]